LKRKTQLDESGQVLILAALCITILMGFVAVAVDVGLLLREKRLLQIAADSAAIAGAAELNNGDVTAGAQADASLNGVTDGVNGATVAVSQPSAGYVQVIASQSQPTFFMRLFGRSSMTVSALAVAAAVPSTSCVDTLLPNPTAPGKKGVPASIPGVDLANSAGLTLSGCGILDNASGTGAFTMTGNASITAASIGVVGTASIANGITPSPTPVTGIASITDPLSATVTAPPASDYSTGCLADPNYGTGNFTIGPSSPTGFVCYSAFSITKGSPTITLNPGLYIINGGTFNIASGTTMTGTGVTFYFVNGANFTISNGAVLNVSAPTTPPYSGLLFYQDPTDQAVDSFIGGSSGSLNGIFYLPAANLTFENGNNSTFSTDLVVGSLTMTGNAKIKPYAPLAGASPLSSPRLIQ
jgi:Flp pilus assembly protein TadG